MTSLLKVSDLHLNYPSSGWRRVGPEVLRGISLHIGAGETLGLVGESGSGKTTIGRAILGLAVPTSGSIQFDGRDITRQSASDRRKRASDVQVVFQDPYTSLNPALQIEDILAEPLIGQGYKPVDARRKVALLLDQVNLPRDSLYRYAREFSGGQRQRVAIARALALSPRLIVCDEPVSALDLTTQSRVLDLFIEVQQQTGVSYLFITHDLSVVRHISHRIAVMYRGEIVETGSAEQVTSAPTNDYTKSLLLASPVADPALQRRKREERRALRLDMAASGPSS